MRALKQFAKQYDLPKSFADKDGCAIYPINLFLNAFAYNGVNGDLLYLFYKAKDDEKKRDQIEDVLANNLTEREVDILHLRYAYKLTMKQIGEAYYNLSASRIGQIKEKAFRKLNKDDVKKQFFIPPEKYFGETNQQAHDIYHECMIMENEQERKERKERERPKLNQEQLSNLRSYTAMYDNLINEEFPNGLSINEEICVRHSIINYINRMKSEDYLDGDLLRAIREFCEPKNINNRQLNNLFTQILIKYENTRGTVLKKELHGNYKQYFLNYCARLYDMLLMEAESYTMDDALIGLQKDGIVRYYQKGDEENN